jgi:hypothetical protein
VTFSQALALSAVAMLLGGGQGVCSPIAMAAAADGSHGGATMKRTASDDARTAEGTLPAPVAWEQGLPIPEGARRNDALGGATSLAPGKNYTLKVYDIALPVRVVAAFYEHHVPAATRETAGNETKLSVPGGHVRLVPFADGTRITLVVGPH